MDDETKRFFEELAGGGDGVKPKSKSKSEAEIDIDTETEQEYTPKLARAMPAPSAKDHKEVTEKEEVGDIFEEDEGKLTIDVYQTPNEIVVESTIAGVKPDDLDISINNEAVTIRGRRERETKVTDEDYFYQECYWGKFSRSIILPQEVYAENAAASLKNGVLVIRLPKLNRQKSKKLKVRLD